jgi:hypothetical protein
VAIATELKWVKAVLLLALDMVVLELQAKALRRRSKMLWVWEDEVLLLVLELQVLLDMAETPAQRPELDMEVREQRDKGLWGR